MNESDTDTLYWTKVKKLKVKIKLPFPSASPKFGNTKEGLANRKAVDLALEQEKKP